MSATFDEAQDEILTVFKDAWDPTGWIALYENVAGDPPSTATPVPWARVVLRNVTGQQGSLSGALGTQRWDREGNVIIQVFVPAGEGLSRSKNLVKIVVDAFEGVATPLNVRFRNVRTNEIGESGEWFQVNVIADFLFDEIK